MAGGDRKPKIWIVVFTGNSGLTHYSYCLARALEEAGCDVTLVTNKNYELDWLPAAFPIIKLFGRTRRYPIDIVRYWRLFRRRRPDVVHYQYFLKFPVVEAILLKLQKKAGASVVLTAHDWLPHNRRFYHRALFRRVYTLPDRIVVHSRAGSGFLERELGVDPGKLAVVPHGHYGLFDADPGLGAGKARERLHLDPDRFWFLFFGRIDPHKGLDVALRALAMMKAGSGNKKAGLLVAGDVSRGSMEIYARLIENLGLHERVSLHVGFIPVSEIQVYFKAADAVVLPYRESSTSGIAHLSMGFRKPVVATAVGGLADVIQDGVTGLLVPAADEGKLARAMEKVASDDETRRRLAAGWDTAQEQYSWENVARLTIKVYDSLQNSK